MENEILDTAPLVLKETDPQLRRKFRMVAWQILINCILNFISVFTSVGQIYLFHIRGTYSLILLIQAIISAIFGIILFRAWINLYAWISAEDPKGLEKNSKQLATFFLVNLILIFMVIILYLLRYLF